MTVARPRQAVCSVRDACRRLRQAGHTGAAAGGVGRQVEQGQASVGLELGGRETRPRTPSRGPGWAWPGGARGQGHPPGQGARPHGKGFAFQASDSSAGVAESGRERAGRRSRGGRGHGEPARASGRGDGETGLARGDILKINPARCCTLGLRNSHDIR